MLFFACFWSFINFRLGSLYYYYLILFSNTCFSIPFSELIILVYSSLSLNASFIFMIISFIYLFISSLLNIIIAGMGFIFLFMIEFFYGLFSIADYFIDCIFIFTTTLHGFHVLCGMIMFYIYSYYCIFLFGVMNNDLYLGYYIVSIYWHFVDFI